MQSLVDQEQFESQIWRPERPNQNLVVVYFTASWCGACKRLDLDHIMAEYPRINWYKCDVDQNDYTGPFCGVKSLPTFVAFHAGTVLDKLSNSSTDNVIAWLSDVSNLVKVKKS